MPGLSFWAAEIRLSKAPVSVCLPESSPFWTWSHSVAAPRSLGWVRVRSVGAFRAARGCFFPSVFLSKRTFLPPDCAVLERSGLGWQQLATDWSLWLPEGHWGTSANWSAGLSWIAWKLQDWADLRCVTGPGGGEHLEALRRLPEEAESARMSWRGWQRPEVNLNLLYTYLKGGEKKYKYFTRLISWIKLNDLSFFKNFYFLQDFLTELQKHRAAQFKRLHQDHRQVHWSFFLFMVFRLFKNRFTVRLSLLLQHV